MQSVNLQWQILVQRIWKAANECSALNHFPEGAWKAQWSSNLTLKIDTLSRSLGSEFLPCPSITSILLHNFNWYFYLSFDFFIVFVKQKIEKEINLANFLNKSFSKCRKLSKRCFAALIPLSLSVDGQIREAMIEITNCGSKGQVNMLLLLLASYSFDTSCDHVSVWPNLAKFWHFGKILKVIGNFLGGLFSIWQNLKPTWIKFMPLSKFMSWQIAQYNNNLAIWLHCLL